ncbi:hypothetical protein B0T14DRAFT_601296 [Immersiella caudata]|uniref:Uncharacterized protein n=1 Tax=Immersiella caudata TaxID=314043 RepID=A0AA40C2G4_9PEZI|nr:hypothetical protein B0T14DRAFT_601296 [Immersiella caudata]
MQLKSPLSLLPLLPTLTYAQVRLTHPDPSTKINLSSPSITLTWAVDNGVAEASYVVDIWFHQVSPQKFGYELVENYPNAAGTNSYEWNPKSQVEALKKSGMVLSGGKDFMFDLRFHERNGSRGSGVVSERFAVEGFSPMSSDGVGVRVGMGAVLVGGLVGVGGFLLLF